MKRLFTIATLLAASLTATAGTTGADGNWLTSYNVTVNEQHILNGQQPLNQCWPNQVDVNHDMAGNIIESIEMHKAMSTTVSHYDVKMDDWLGYDKALGGILICLDKNQAAFKDLHDHREWVRDQIKRKNRSIRERNNLRKNNKYLTSSVARYETAVADIASNNAILADCKLGTGIFGDSVYTSGDCKQAGFKQKDLTTTHGFAQIAVEKAEKRVKYSTNAVDRDKELVAEEQDKEATKVAKQQAEEKAQAERKAAYQKQQAERREAARVARQKVLDHRAAEQLAYNNAKTKAERDVMTRKRLDERLQCMDDIPQWIDDEAKQAEFMYDKQLNKIFRDFSKHYHRDIAERKARASVSGLYANVEAAWKRSADAQQNCFNEYPFLENGVK
ncbi:hypothetical protein [Psychromonas aquimarina]|uniref:hypothetical protein n=1 Tax=Psychromonas aquimarina TaxID=444919 RepID=UPI000417DB62|nr:hypothetical protein [Psychromonas aquimarina]